MFAATPVPAVRATPRQGVRAVLLETGLEERAVVEVTFAPLASLIWIGAALAVAGGALILLPVTEER
jgi:cytochrome c biogenesis factor